MPVHMCYAYDIIIYNLHYGVINPSRAKSLLPPWISRARQHMSTSIQQSAVTFLPHTLFLQALPSDDTGGAQLVYVRDHHGAAH